jgi:ATP-dependent protease HslVU (ClpYQ) peptidase subunit
MTCIIALREKGRVHIGGDSHLGDDWLPRVTLNPKVFRVGDFVIGFTDSVRMGQLLQYHLEVEPQGDEPNMAYIVRVFVEGVRQCFRDFGFAKVQHEQDEGGLFLVGYRGRIYEVHRNFQVEEYEGDFWACGCGAKQALVAMHLLENLQPVARIRSSLAAVARYSIGVRGPFHVVSLEAGPGAGGE